MPSRAFLMTEPPEWMRQESTSEVFATTAGALIGILAGDQKVHWQQGLSAIVVAFLVGVFAAPGILEWIGYDSPRINLAIAVLVGLFAVPGTQLLQHRFWAAADALLTKFLGGGNAP